MKTIGSSISLNAWQFWTNLLSLHSHHTVGHLSKTVTDSNPDDYKGTGPNFSQAYPDSKLYGANMGPIWGQQDPGGPHELCYLGTEQA